MCAPSQQLGNTALMAAAQEGQASCVSLLLSKGANVDAKNCVRPPTALRTASQRDSGGARSRRRRVQVTGDTALAVAVAFEQEGCAKALLEGGADVDARDIHVRARQTPAQGTILAPRAPRARAST